MIGRTGAMQVRQGAGLVSLDVFAHRIEQRRHRFDGKLRDGTQVGGISDS
jgi:hypothetical protein